MLNELTLGVTPKGFYAVDMVSFATGKVFAMIDAKVLVAINDQAIVAAPTVSIND